MTPKVERDQKYVGFIPAYQWIVARPNGLSTIIKMERSYSAAVSMLMNGKETSLENLRIRLSTETDVALKTLDPEQVSELVNKHVVEMEQAQKKWNREIKELKQRQKQEYHNFVKEYYLSEQLLVSVNESLHSFPAIPGDLPSPTPLPPLPSSTPPPASTPRDRSSSTPRENPASTTPRNNSSTPISTPRENPPSSTPRDTPSSTPRTRASSTSLPVPSIPPNPSPTPAPTTPSVPPEASTSSSALKFNLPIPITNAKKVLAAFPFGKAKTDSMDNVISPDPSLSSSPANSTPFLPSTPTPSPAHPFPAHTNLPSSPVPSPLYNNDPLYFLNKEGREISKKLFFHETIPVYLGRQRKNLFYFKLFSGELIEFCAPKDPYKTEKAGEDEGEEGEGKGSRARQRKKMASSLYGDSLSGLVLLVSPDLTYKSETCAEFVKICGASTEFHFDTFKKQLAKVKGANTRLNSGDFFITKHSNLLHVNVVFHLVVDNADASLQEEIATFSPSSNAALGLRNIVLTASQCDVHSLVIPAALSEPGLESMVASEGALKNRLDVVAKTVRLALSSTGEGGSLKTVQFVVREPPHTSEQPLYKKLKALLTTSNKTQQLAFKI
eukprot:Phypoly_transcript_04624.p1 GENE.Phypoly_transcript_04624~~Phypoly_transcript_04624.p1  ORF type:complete len:691 (+),score=185.95 Phypoly_transcript_04624:243-2075(+)